MVVQATLMLFGSFFIMLFAGVPISAGIGIASVITAFACGMDPAVFALTAAQRCFSGVDSFSLLALPFFSLGGNIMNKGGIAKRLVRLARLLVGKVPGLVDAKVRRTYQGDWDLVLDSVFDDAAAEKAAEVKEASAEKAAAAKKTAEEAAAKAAEPAGTAQ